MQEKCTWKDCAQPAEVPQVNANGDTWANLCKPHDDSLTEVLKGGDVKKLMSSYVKAKGGAHAIAKQMTDEIFGKQ